MISLSKLLCRVGAAGDGLRYGDPSDGEQIRRRRQRRPVVVWNVTKGCNLACEHCYAAAADPVDGELSTAEGKRLLDDLVEYGVPVVLFSGGEPLVRSDLVELVKHAADAGLRPVLSTNGTLLTRERARTLREAGLAYAGVSLDGHRETNDAFRGRAGAFNDAVAGMRACLDVGLKTGLRYTVTRDTVGDLNEVVDLLTDVGVDRFCFYHLDYGGRGVNIVDTDLSPERRRAVVRRLCDLTREYHAAGDEVETLLVGNYADAGFLIEYAREELGEQAAARIYRFLARSGGDPAGSRVADVDYRGNVHLTQFWQGYSLGNVRDRPFAALWEDESNPLLARLRDRGSELATRCQDCRYRAVCAGGSPLRSLTVHGDPFAPDPQCYLTDQERAGQRPNSADTDTTVD